MRTAMLLLVACGAVSGCVTPWEKKSLLSGKDTDIEGIQGPTERRLRGWKREQEKDEQEALVNVSGSLKPIVGTEEYLAAEELYDDGKYPEAEQAFKKLARKYEPGMQRFYHLATFQYAKANKKTNKDIREDALFMKGQCAYEQGHFSDAENAYAELLRDYPSTRHLDDVSKRLFEIARQWLDFPKAADIGEVQQVNYDNFRKKLPADQPPEKRRTPVFIPNFTDKKRPWFDTEGNGVACLRLIWLNDPTGPLADDALMLAASHYARRGDYIEADRHYTLLREEYPNSPHVQKAFVLGSHVKLMSYQGSAYDGKTLEDAEHLKESILRLYPDLEDKQRIEGELRRIEEAKAARVWDQVVFYHHKNNLRAQAVFCHLVIDRFPKTSYADKARARLKQLGPKYESGQVLLTARPDPKPNWWSNEEGARKVRSPGFDSPPAKPPVAKPAVEKSASPDKPDSAPPRRLNDLFRWNRNDDPSTEPEPMEQDGEPEAEPPLSPGATDREFITAGRQAAEPQPRSARFSLPRWLSPSEEPVEEPSTEADAGKTKL